MKCLRARPEILLALSAGSEAEHTQSCTACARTFERMKKLYFQISELPLTDAPAPPSLAKTSKGNPIFAPFRFFQWIFLSSNFSRWVPTFRSFSMKNGGIEGLVTAGLLVLVMAVLPKLRDLQDSQLQRRLQAYLPNFVIGERPMPVVDSAGLGISDRSIASISSESEIDDFADEAVEAELESSGKTEKLAAKSQAWRFNLKTDNPNEVRRRIVQFINTQLNDKKDIRGSVNGVVVPGGIQFDLLVPHDRVFPLKEHLEKLAAKANEPNERTSLSQGQKTGSENLLNSSIENFNEGQTAATPLNANKDLQLDSKTSEELLKKERTSVRQFSAGQSTIGEGFTWYRNRSKRELPEGYSRVVIWLSQI